MRKIFFVFTFAILCSSLLAQNQKMEWFTDLETAKEYAATNDADILMVFSGSDWCKPCIQFKKDILEATDFQNWGSDRLAILYLDFPARKKNKLSAEQTAHNEALAERFNKSGAFPNIILMDKNERVLANPRFKNQSTEQFATELQSHLTASK